MPDKKTELQVTLEAILDKKKGKHGNLFQIKIKHYKPMWVSDQKVSKEAVAAYLSGSRGVPKNSYVVLARRYAKPPVDTKMKSIHSFFGKRSPPKTSAGSPEKKRSRNDVDKTGTETERTSAMLMAAREYIKEQTSTIYAYKTYIKCIACEGNGCVQKAGSSPVFLRRPIPCKL